MQRFILEIGSGADLYGRDYTKAALRALDDALRHSSITLFHALNIDHTAMKVRVTIGVQEPDLIDQSAILAAIPRGEPELIVLFGGHNVDTRGDGEKTVVATCAVEALLPNQAAHFKSVSHQNE